MSAILSILIGSAATGGSSGPSAEVTQFFDRLLTPPDTSWSPIYTDFIDGLVSDGIWNDLDGLFVLAAVDSTTSLIDLTTKASSPHLYTNAGSPGTFAAKVGWTTANLSLLQYGFKPAVDATHLTQNDCSVFTDVSLYNSNATGTAFIQTSPTDDLSADLNFYIDDTQYGVASSATSDPSGSWSTGLGFWLLQRTSSSAIAAYRDNALVTSDTNTSTTLSSGEITNRGTGNQFRLTGWGKSFDSTKRTALFSRVTTLLAAIDALP